MPPRNTHKALTTRHNKASKAPANGRTDEDICNRLLRAYDPMKGISLQKVIADAKFGEEWIEAKKDIRLMEGMTIQKWIVKNTLPFSHQYANGCGRLARVFRQSFDLADDWYQQSGIADGWRTKKNTGWEYGLEVIDLYNRHLNDETPASGAAAKKEKEDAARQRKKDLQKALADREKEVAALFDALEHLNDLYSKTPQGADYVDPTLHAVRAARQHAEAPAAGSGVTEVRPANHETADVSPAPIRKTRKRTAKPVAQEPAPPAQGILDQTLPTPAPDLHVI